MATEYMKRIGFLDGQILHDFHLNIMQKNIAEAIKTRTTQERYDMLLLVSPYNYYFVEPFIDTSNRDSSSTAELNTLTFSIDSGQWITGLLELPEATSEIYLLSLFEDDPANNAIVKFSYRTKVTDPWIQAKVDVPIYLAQPSKYIQLKVDCQYSGTVRPVVYDFALFVK